MSRGNKGMAQWLYAIHSEIRIVLVLLWHHTCCTSSSLHIWYNTRELQRSSSQKRLLRVKEKVHHVKAYVSLLFWTFPKLKIANWFHDHCTSLYKGLCGNVELLYYMPWSCMRIMDSDKFKILQFKIHSLNGSYMCCLFYFLFISI